MSQGQELELKQASAAKGPHRRKPRKPLRFISGEAFFLDQWLIAPIFPKGSSLKS